MLVLQFFAEKELASFEKSQRVLHAYLQQYAYDYQKKQYVLPLRNKMTVISLKQQKFSIIPRNLLLVFNGDEILLQKGHKKNLLIGSSTKYGSTISDILLTFLTVQ